LLFTLYSCVGGFLILIGIPFYAIYCIFTKRHLNSIKERFGFWGSKHATWQQSTRIWLHAASVGEVQVAKALIAELDKTGLKADLVITTVTEQGQIVAQNQLGKRALCIYAPLDLPWIITKFIRQIRPSLYICLETELWPNMLKVAKQQGIKTLLLNGRMSDRSFEHYRFIGRFMKQVMSCLSYAAMIDDDDKDKYIALGLAPEKVVVCGNAKYDLNNAAKFNQRNQQANNHIGRDDETIVNALDLKPGQKVLVAGSTHNGEEEILLQVHQGLRHELSDLITIIAPRHLNRLPAIETFLKKHRLEFQKLSELKNAPRSSKIILVDYMGELAALYSVASFAFCGGSLVERGGHNIIEPAIYGIPPFFGPHMRDFSYAARIFCDKKAGFQIHSAQELIDKIIYFSRNQDKYNKSGLAAKKIAESQQGASGRQVKLILQIIES
jgi:3-deoxy-D-manno-octulosonic-acid transferase